MCQGEGPTDDAALAAAHGICNDKVCRLCGVEVESVVQTKETLKGVVMKRKVVGYEDSPVHREEPSRMPLRPTYHSPAWRKNSSSRATSTSWEEPGLLDTGQMFRTIRMFSN